MPTPYTPTATQHTTVTLPAGGDKRLAASVAAPLEAALDNAQYAIARTGSYAIIVAQPLIAHSPSDDFAADSAWWTWTTVGSYDNGSGTNGPATTILGVKQYDLLVVQGTVNVKTMGGAGNLKLVTTDASDTLLTGSIQGALWRFNTSGSIVRCAFSAVRTIGAAEEAAGNIIARLRAKVDTAASLSLIEDGSVTALLLRPNP